MKRIGLKAVWFVVTMIFVAGAFACNEDSRSPQEGGRIKDLTSKIGLYESRLKSGEKDPKTVSNIVVLLFQRAQAYEKNNRPQEAKQDYKEILEFKPSHSPARYRLGRLLINAGKYEEGIKELEKIVHQNPEYSYRLYDLLARGYKELGEPDKARKALLKSITLKPINPEAYKALAGLDKETGKSEEARDAEQKARHLEEYGYADRGYKDMSLKEWRELASSPEKRRKSNISLAIALYNAATYLDHKVKPGDYFSYRNAMKNWQKYLAASKNKEDERDYRKAVKAHVTELKHQKKDLLREHHLLVVEEVWGHCSKTLQGIAKIEVFLPALEEKARQQGKEEVARLAAQARQQLQGIDTGPYEKSLRDIIEDCKDIISRELTKEVDMDDAAITAKGVELDKRFQKIESELSREGLDEIEKKMEKVARELNFKIPKHYFKEVHEEKLKKLVE